MQRILEQVGLSTGLERTENLHVARVGRQHDNSCVGKFIANRNERVEAIHFRHLQVHQRNVRMVRPELLDGFATVGRFTYQNHVRLNANQTGDPLAYDGMIVDRKNSNCEMPALMSIPTSCLALSEQFLKTRNVCSSSGRRCWQERAVPLRYPHRLRSTPSTYLRSVWRAPAYQASHSVPHALTGENRRIDALSIVPHTQSELLIVITDFNFDLLCLGVLKGVPQRFGSNFVNFVAKDGMQISRLALNRYAEC